MELQHGGVALAVDQQVAVQRTLAEFTLGQLDIDVLAFEGTDLAGYIGERHRRAVQQRHVEDAGDRGHLLQPGQFFAQLLDIGKHLGAEQFLFGAVGDDQKVVGAVTLANAAIVLEAGIVL